MRPSAPTDATIDIDADNAAELGLSAPFQHSTESVAGRFTDPDAGAASDPTFARALTNHHR